LTVGADALLGYPELIAEVRRVCAQGRSGCVFITTSENHAVRFELWRGKIIGLSFRQLTGAKAIDAIRRITAGRLRYSEEVINHPPQEGLLPTPELLGALGAPGLAPTPVDGVSPAAGREELARRAVVIQSELAEFLGPMAQFICKEHMALAANVTDLVESLARELRDAAKVASFKERVHKRLADTTPAKA
jgi:hypothetical protein